MKVLLGIGNPGRRYEGTRHNVGFRVVDRLVADDPGARWRTRARFQAELAQAAWDGIAVLLVKPLTYVNRSGVSARAVCDYHDATPADLLVVVDDVNLPTGRLRFRSRGSAGGHNGLKSLIEHLGADAFARLRIGVGARRREEQDLADHVLSRFDPEERDLVEQAVARAADGCRAWVRDGIEACMNRYNGTGEAGRSSG